MADKQLSFAARIAQMRETASLLRTASETVALEAERMAAAEQRFATRRATRKEAR